jgi:hypothetical protein
MSGRNRAVATNRKCLQEAVRAEPNPTTAIRFSNADGKVLSWTASRASVRTELRVRGELRRAIPSPGKAITSLSDRREGVSDVKPANHSYTDFTVISGYVAFFRLLAAGTALGILKAVFRNVW